MKDILVVSHERSRTHFVINTFGNCFGFDINQIDVPPTTNRNVLLQFFENYKPTGKNILKSHHQFETLHQFKNIIEEKFKMFYVIREGRDVLTSCHFYFNKAGAEFPFTKTVGDLMRQNPQRFSFDAAYSDLRSNTMVERWVRHVYSFSRNYHNMFSIINSDRLYINYKDMVNFMAFILNEKPSSYLRPIVGKSRSVAPRKGIIGDFIEHFSDADNEFFFKEISKIDPKDELYNCFLSKSKIYAEYRGE